MNLILWRCLDMSLILPVINIVPVKSNYSREQYRKKTFCPLKRCNAKAQVQLAVHIKNYHSDIPKAERLRLTKTACVAPQKLKPIKHTQEKKILLSFFKAGPSPILDSSTKVDPAPQSTAPVPALGLKIGTRNLTRHDVTS